MKKTILYITGLSILALLVAGTAHASAMGGEGSSSDKTKAEVKESSGRLPSEAEAATIVYYFFTKKRCASCLKIEEYTREALETIFKKELESGQMVWRPVNMEEPEHTHYMDDFELFTKSVVLVRQQGDRVVAWKNLPKIWELLNDKTAFIDYIEKEVRRFPGAP